MTRVPGIVGIALGAVGLAVAFVGLSSPGQDWTFEHVMLIASSVLLGCGLIALTIGLKK